MSDYCVRKPCVKNKNGELVDSKLWDDLFRITGKDRARTIELYKIANSDTFMKSAADEAEYDMNGQITAHSFLKLAGLDAELSNEFKQLSKTYDSQIDESDLDKTVRRFNSEQSKSDYIPSVSDDSDGKLNVRIVRRSENAIGELAKRLEDNKLTGLISNRLKELGVAYDFVGSLDYNGRFSTQNASRMSDGLYHLIQLSTNSKDINDSLVEEAAHLAVMATRDKFAVKRLIDAIADLRKRERLDSMFTNEEIELAKANPKNIDLELAGIVVKKAMQRKTISGWNNLVGSVKSFIYGIFSKLGLTKVMRDKALAKRYGEAIASGFLFDEDNFSLDNALENPVKLYSLRTDNQNTKFVEQTMKRLSILNNKLMQASYKMASTKEYMSLRPGELLGDRNELEMNEAFASTIASNAIDTLWNDFQTNYGVLSRISAKDFRMEDISRTQIDNLMRCIEVFDSLKDICEAYMSLASNTRIKYEQAKVISDDLGDRLKPSAAMESTLKIIKDINEALSDGKIAMSLMSYSRIFTASLLEFTYGRDNTTIPAKMVFKGLSTEVEKEHTVDMYDLASAYMRDFSYDGGILSGFSSFIRSKRFSKDSLTQAMDKIARKSRTIAMKYRDDRLSQLRDIRHKLKESGFDEDTFYEKVVAPPKVEIKDDYYVINGKPIAQVSSIDGLPVVHDVDGVWRLDDIDTQIPVDYVEKTQSGYYISEYNHRQLWIDRRVADRLVKSQFIKEAKSTMAVDENGDEVSEYILFKRMPASKRRSIYYKYRDNTDIWKRFIKESYEDPKIGKPSEKYRNKEFQRNIERYGEKWLDLYNEIMEYKRAVDSECLSEREEFGSSGDISGKRHFVEYKRPQYKKSFVGKYLSHRLDSVDLYDSQFTTLLCEDVTSDAFGDITTDTELNEFNDELSLYADGLRRIPINGINDVSDIRELSDDLVGSLFAYTDMAYRFFGAQQVYSSMSVLDYTADNRGGGDFTNTLKLKNIGERERNNIMNTFIYGNDIRERGWRKVFSVLNKIAGVVCIRLLCINLFSALKNKYGGLSVFLKDSSFFGDTYDFKTKHLISAWFNDTFNPRHWAGSVWSKITNKEVSWDRYQKLTDRFDRFRNPRVRSEFSKRWNPLKHLTNALMANYDLTDTSLIAIIYRTYLKNRFVYDSDGKKINLEQTYSFDKDNNPILKGGLIKEERNIGYARLLRDAKEALEEMIRNNNDNSSQVVLHANDDDRIAALADFINKNARILNGADVNIELVNKDGSYKPESKLLKIIENELNNISYTVDDEANFINEVDEYIAISQGYYGAINASEFQTNEYSAAFAKMKGWLMAFVQRDFLNNVNMSTGKMMSGIMNTQALALATAFMPKVDPSTKDLTFIKDYRFRLATLTAMLIPFALKSKKLRNYLARSGWDPSQLAALSFGAISNLINIFLVLLAYLFRRGNRKSMGEKMSQPKESRTGKHNKYRKPGIFGDFEMFDDESYQEDYNRWEKKGYPKRGSQKSMYNISDMESLDYPQYYLQDLPDDAEAGDIVYVIDKGIHYKYYDSNKTKGWKPYILGYYEYGSQEWNEHDEALQMKNIVYDKNNPMYYFCGFAYKMLRGISSEALTLNDAVAMGGEIVDLSKSVIFSGGFKVLFDGLENILSAEESTKKSWGEREINFYLKKFQLELDGPGKTIARVNGHKITVLDFYSSQEVADRYKKTNSNIGIPTQEQLWFK